MMKMRERSKAICADAAPRASMNAGLSAFGLPVPVCRAGSKPFILYVFHLSRVYVTDRK